MKVYISNHHCLTTICGTPYLLPYGQGIVDYERQLKLNDTASNLWKYMEKIIPKSGIERDLLASELYDLSLSAADGHKNDAGRNFASDEDSHIPLSDAYDFIDTLIECGALY